MLKASITPEMHYDDWASAYDTDVKGWDYLAPGKIFEKLRDILPRYEQPPKILDVGIGTGLLPEKIRTVRADSHIIGIDVSSGMLDLCKQRGVADELYKLDVSEEKFPFKDNRFDIITAAGVMESVGNIGNAMQQMARVLKPGGYMIFTYVPAVKSPVRETATKNLRPGRTAEGRFVMGKLAMYSHSALKMRVYASSMGIKTKEVDNFVGYRTYVFLTVNYDMFIGEKRGSRTT